MVVYVVNQPNGDRNSVKYLQSQHIQMLEVGHWRSSITVKREVEGTESANRQTTDQVKAKGGSQRVDIRIMRRTQGVQKIVLRRIMLGEPSMSSRVCSFGRFRRWIPASRSPRIIFALITTVLSLASALVYSYISNPKSLRKPHN